MLISGRGSNLQAIMRAVRKGDWALVRLVLSNRADAGLAFSGRAEAGLTDVRACPR